MRSRVAPSMPIKPVCVPWVCFDEMRILQAGVHPNGSSASESVKYWFQKHSTATRGKTYPTNLRPPSQRDVVRYDSTAYTLVRSSGLRRVARLAPQRPGALHRAHEARRLRLGLSGGRRHGLCRCERVEQRQPAPANRSALARGGAGGAQQHSDRPARPAIFRRGEG